MKKKSQHAMQEAWMKAATPGMHHEHLQAMIGSWEYTSKMWMDPAAPPTESMGTCERKMILGGRYLYEEFKGDAMGMPFEGIGITGYDNIEEQYKSIWIDNMGTTIMVGNGKCADEGKILKMEMEYTDPMSGKLTKAWTVSTMTDPNKHLFEYHGMSPDGKKYKMMEIMYTRK